jgi:hypothetical protein
MRDRYARIQFMVANYSKLQGLREVPFGLLAAAVSVWAMHNHGPAADLTLPILFAIGAALLYWLIDRFYAHTFGRVRQTAKMRLWEITVSIFGSLLALLAFWLDITKNLPFSALGLLFAAMLFEDFWRATHSGIERALCLYPENFMAACLILVLSFLPLIGLAWWEKLGLRSQAVSMVVVFGILLVLAGTWGHLRMVHILSTLKVKSNDNTRE